LSARAGWQGSEETVDGVLIIHNPATPAEGEVELELKPLFSLGGESTDPNQLFGMVDEILVDDQYNSYLLDRQLNEIKIFDAKGEYLRTIGRKGEGPGEFNQPNTFFFLPKDRIGVSQMMPARIAVLDEQGQGHDDFPIPGDTGFTFVTQVRSEGNRVVMKEIVSSLGKGDAHTTIRLLGLDPKGKQLVIYGEQSKPLETSGGGVRLNLSDIGLARQWAIGSNGLVYLTNGFTGYRIEVHGPDGKIERVIEREYEPLPYSKKEMEWRRKDAEEQERSGLSVEVEVPENKPDIEGLFVRPNGELWVRTSRSVGEDGGMGSFDVYDARGHFQYQVRPQLAFDDDKDGFVLTGDRLYRIKELNGARKAWAAGFGGGIRIKVDGEDEEDEGEPEPLAIMAFELPLDFSQMRD
jgi:hypothetical protein